MSQWTPPQGHVWPTYHQVIATGADGVFYTQDREPPATHGRLRNARGLDYRPRRRRTRDLSEKTANRRKRPKMMSNMCANLIANIWWCLNPRARSPVPLGFVCSSLNNLLALQTMPSHHSKNSGGSTNHWQTEKTKVTVRPGPQGQGHYGSSTHELSWDRESETESGMTSNAAAFRATPQALVRRELERQEHLTEQAATNRICNEPMQSIRNL